MNVAVGGTPTDVVTSMNDSFGAGCVAVPAPKRGARSRRPEVLRGVDDAATLPLTAAQISLIRSSIKAGVTPSVLSRQLGLSRAQIRAALEGQKKGQREAGPS